MKLLYRKGVFYALIFVFGICILVPQLLHHHRHVKRVILSSQNIVQEGPHEAIAIECLKSLKDKRVKRELRNFLKDKVKLTGSVLMSHLPHCSKYSSTKLVNQVIGLLQKPLEEYIEDNFDFESPWPNRTDFLNATHPNLCPLQSPLLQGPLNISFNDTGEISDGDLVWNWPPTLEEVALEFQNQIKLGGQYEPSSCKCRGSTAFIIPFRDRDQHLRFFLHYNHEILRRQQLCYVIIVLEQDDDKTFNKGQLMNTGFLYAKNLSTNIDCFVFHDVDVISEDDRVIYTCRDNKTIHHIAPYINKYNYEFCCGVTVGAAIAFTKEQFEDLNGFSNEYAGWGGEDDDMDFRIKHKNYEIWRSQKNYTRFMMVAHDKDAGNPKNNFRMELLHNSTSRILFDGLTSLRTVITSVVRHPTHTRVKVKTFEPYFLKSRSTKNKETMKSKFKIPNFKL